MNSKLYMAKIIVLLLISITTSKAQFLDEFKKDGDKVSYERYAQSLLSDEEKSKNVDALPLAKEKALSAIKLFEEINHQREQKIIKNILNLKLPVNEGVAMVIGGIHVKEIENALKKNKIHVEIYTPKGYVETDQGLIDDIKRNLTNDSKK